MRVRALYGKVLDVHFKFGGEIALIRSIVLTIFSIGIAFVVSANGQHALAQESAACDPDFETVMEARATLEAMREVEIAQRLILKPDSVLEYSCFHSRAAAVGAADVFSDDVAGDLFKFPPDMFSPSGPYSQFLPTIDDTAVSEANNNGGFRVQPGADAPGGVLTAFDLDTTIADLVLASILEHVNTNFGHTYAGGYLPTPSTGVCGAMDSVWEFLKCDNFNKAVFTKLEDMSVLDPRFVSSYPALNCNDSNRATTWSNAYAAAYPDPGAAGGVDPLVTHVDQFVNSCAGVTPVPTGVRVYRAPASPPNASIVDLFDDAVCPAPGCYYDGSGSCVP